MAIIEHDQEKVFDYRFEPIRIVDSIERQFDVVANATVSDIDNDELSSLCTHRKLKVGLKLLESDSRSRVLAEYRASHVSIGPGERSFKAKFSIPREMFDDRQCRLAQLDLVYENKFWFDGILNNPTFVPIWIEKKPVEIDVFEYYKNNYLLKKGK